MLLPVQGIVNPVPNHRFYQVLNDQCEPSIVEKNRPVAYLRILAVNSERTADCCVSHRVGSLVVVAAGGSDLCDPTPVTPPFQSSPQTMLSSARRVSKQLVVATTRRSAVRSFSKTCARPSDAIFVVSWLSFRMHPHKYISSGWTASGHRI